MSQIPIGLQLYTVRDEMAKDYRGTIRRVADIGYAGVELAGPNVLEAAELSDLLAELNLRPCGAHIALGEFENNLDAVIAYHSAIGNPYLGVPALPGELRNPAGFRQVAATMNRVGAEVKAAGMTLYYHNHAFEFEGAAGERGLDILYGETDPELVKLEADVYWYAYAGKDPAALIGEYAGRFPLIHLKDMVGEGDDRTFAEVGAGTIDLRAVMAAAEAQGAEWFIVEQDRCAGPSLESARLSFENLRKWGKV